jgi:hypothetical protein
VYTREREPADIPKNPSPLDKIEYLLYSNDHPLLEFRAREDPLTRWTGLYVGYENPKTGKKEMVQTRKFVVRAVSKEKQRTVAEAGKEGESQSVRLGLLVLIISIPATLYQWLIFCRYSARR